SVFRIDNSQDRRLTYDLDLLISSERAVSEPFQIAGDSHDAVTVMTRKIGADERFSEPFSLLSRAACGHENVAHKLPKIVRSHLDHAPPHLIEPADASLGSKLEQIDPACHDRSAGGGSAKLAGHLIAITLRACSKRLACSWNCRDRRHGFLPPRGSRSPRRENSRVRKERDHPVRN